jgi:DNA (cytosine-5)-methyltransferase 1
MGKKFVSLFCGCGGFDIGFIQAGYKCISAFDNDPIAIEAYSKNIDANVKLQDLSKSFNCNQFADVDVVIAGPPCQGFSTAGKMRYNDPRNHLLIRAVEISLSLKPKVIVIENVNGVVSKKLQNYWEKAKCLLKKKYNVREYLFNTKDFGLAQIRKRRLLIASKNGIDSNIHLPEKEPLSLNEVMTNIALSLPNHRPEHLYEKGHLGMIAKHIKPGQKLSNVRGGVKSVHTWNIPEVFGHVSETEVIILEVLLKLRRRKRIRNFGDADPVSAKIIFEELGIPEDKIILSNLIEKNYIRKIGNKFDLTNTFNGKYKRLHWKEPAPTVITRFGDPRYFLHPDEDRGMTVRESARIQGFPDDYIFPGKKVDQYRLVGNAVPPPMGKKIGELISHLIY